jgi:stage II sporulation protein D
MSARPFSRLCGLIALALAMIPSACRTPPGEQPPSRQSVDEKQSDELLQQAAINALGEREGAILIIDPQTGRVRASVNPRLASEQTFPPGSAIKPLTTLAALRSGTLTRETRRDCRGRYVNGDFEIVCSHPRSATPFNLPQALAYSCNDYFAQVGERLSESAFHATLAAFGFGTRTGLNTGNEAAGRLPGGEWHPRTALGDAPDLLVTPAQMLAAFTALVNGGKLYRPQISTAADFAPQLKSSLQIAPAHRAVIIEGMRGAVVYGTAAAADLDSLPGYIFGKTGTSTASNGFRTQGWFIGFLADGAKPSPEQIRLGVLVFLRRAHGADGAQVARPIFEAFAPRNETATAAAGERVKVRLVSENLTRELSLDAYLRGVVATEGSTENEPEALRALAVATRSYALHNRGRHARDGYDFCSTTHCQRFTEVAPSEGAQRAVAETKDVTLEDDRGGPIEAYFHASCGGATTDSQALWGAPSPSYLRGVRDDFCIADDQNRWVDRIPAAQLVKALGEDERTAVGARLDRIVITQRDASGRAQWLALEGARRRLVRGWDFKMVVGRTLGWNLLKSTYFDVLRAGNLFVFRGRGFGHGLGLCQTGAHVAARRGMGYRQILAHYFPGARLANSSAHPLAERTSFTQRARRSLASEHFRVTIPGKNEDRDAETILRTLEAGRADISGRLRAAGLILPGRRSIEVYVHATTAEFIAETGQPGFAAAATRDGTIALQPLELLNRRRILAQTLRHEYAHSVIDELGRGRAPRWLAEGMASHLAGEGQLLMRTLGGEARREKLSTAELERRLKRPASADEMRTLYAEAYRVVRDLIRTEGEAALWRRIATSE